MDRTSSSLILVALHGDAENNTREQPEINEVELTVLTLGAQDGGEIHMSGTQRHSVIDRHRQSAH